MKAAVTCILVAFSVAACSSLPAWEDEAPVKVEAIVREYSPTIMNMDFANGRSSTTRLFEVDLEVMSPLPRFEHRLRIYSLNALEESNPLTQIGARVTFTVSRKYLVEILTDPTKKHDFSFLYTDSLKELRLVH